MLVLKLLNVIQIVIFLKIIKKVLIGSELIKAEECDEADNN
jgi:hypothetical protein